MSKNDRLDVEDADDENNILSGYGTVEPNAGGRDDGVDRTVSITRVNSIFTLSAVVITLATLSIFALSSSSGARSYFRSSLSSSKNKATSASKSPSTSTPFIFTTTRDGYDPLFYFDHARASEFLKYKFLEGYIGIIEPNVANNLYIFTGGSESETDVYYQYKVCKSMSTSECYTGTSDPLNSQIDSINIGCTPFDSYSISVSKYSTTEGELIGGESGMLMCMYVRREMRELTASDLSATMDAMKVLWDVDTATGQETYGDNYKGIDYLIGFHFFNAAWQDGDHIHEGLGFFPQHLKLTNFFEESVQAVDPSFALPFWDFTIETASDTPVWESPMFTEDTFGSMPTPPDATWGWLYKNTDVDDAKIPDGRWAAAKTGVNTEYPQFNFAHGYMRAPWSMNPSTYITRFTSVDKTLPTCESHYNLASLTDMMDLLHLAPYEPHGSTHGVIGGVYGCDVFDSMRETGWLLDEEAQLNLCKNWLFYLKEMYRQGIIIPKTGCTVNSEAASLSTCGFTCDEDLRSDIVKMAGMILNSDYIVTPEPMTGDAIDAWVDLICNGDGYKSFGGDHLEAASAADPSFWPIHPTMDRLLQARYMVGGFGNYTWPTDPDESYVCDKAVCFHSETKTRYSESSCCMGHYEDDQLMLSTSTSGTDVTYVGRGNNEMLKAVDPTSEDYSVPYIYSTFSWSHCDDTGFSIDDLLSDSYTSYSNGEIPDTVSTVVVPTAQIWDPTDPATTDPTVTTDSTKADPTTADPTATDSNDADPTTADPIIPTTTSTTTTSTIKSKSATAAIIINNDNSMPSVAAKSSKPLKKDHSVGKEEGKQQLLLEQQQEQRRS